MGNFMDFVEIAGVVVALAAVVVEIVKLSSSNKKQK